MAAPQGGHPGQGYTSPDSYAQQQPQQYDQDQGQGFEGPNASSQFGGVPQPIGVKKGRRHYAGQAYDFGAGANSAVGNQQQGGASYPAAPGAGYGGYSPQMAQTGFEQPAYGVGQGGPAPMGAPGYGQPQTETGGYQPPDPGYPAHGVTSMIGGVGGMTQQMGQMGMGGQTQPPPPGHSQQRTQLNQLYPTDLLNQPFNVSELDLPPPPIILPPNVSWSSLQDSVSVLTLFSPVLLHHRMPIVRRNTFGRHSMLSQPVIPCSKNHDCRLLSSSSPIRHSMMWKIQCQ